MSSSLSEPSGRALLGRGTREQKSAMVDCENFQFAWWISPWNWKFFHPSQIFVFQILLSLDAWADD